MKLNEKIVSQFKLALKEEGLRFTSQRLAVLLAVLEDIFASNEHRDCDQIYLSVNKKNNKVSKATIYRTIDVLLNHDFVRKLYNSIGDGSVKYESKFDSFSPRSYDLCRNW